MGSRKKNKATKKHRTSNDDSSVSTKASRKSEKKEQVADDFSSVTVFNSPVVSIRALSITLFDTLKSCVSFIAIHWVAFLLSLVAIVTASYVPLPPAMEDQRESVRDFCLFALYWIGLGVASSIGLGTGLHTFILYLGPHIAQVVIASNKCNQVPVMLPSRWKFENFELCPSVPEEEVTIGFWTVYQAVFLEAFLWGAGTAMGELPPYFVARAASAAGGMDEELEDILADDGKSDTAQKSDQPTSWLEGSKKRLASFLKNYAFMTVLLMASIPNPLFDLAGLMCGHFQLPFMKFFLPTLIGKAVNKVSIQVIFIIVAFSNHMMTGILEFIGKFAPTAKTSIFDAIEEQKKTLFQTQTDLEAKEEPLIKVIWGWCIFLMILYFVVTFLNALVRNQLQQEQRDQRQIKEK